MIYITIFALLARPHCWCSGIMQDSHSCDPGSIPGQCNVTYFVVKLNVYVLKFVLIFLCYI